MDKTIQLVVVAMIAIIAAAVLAFMLQDQSGSFRDFINNQESDASCSVTQTNYRNCIVDEEAFQGMDGCEVPSVDRDCGEESIDESSGSESGSSTEG